ncbi:putative mitochondrial beta-ketoacyl-CoA synthase,beta-ketoacyl-coenzyme A [Leptomonas pyrrhocoris]|uniref:Elongation of fatty acids protein n=1 Tax=Leptomonas pyrrhocoris TaxID=157538 RepID=A0A0N0VE27_LEPPY|nr:putative mitochondrial beta-ketoacyl-CoA synthase,beta-ketoacyl-coenzyme A [Leptomonas pyrrhocoris]XP_015655683.1 putative mitochondrial beta-ketoacyl-CoA synthase,beta-ketoacyl-coenzyme A [Leptomonas pyrrhocoris]XP_015655684.1 putative mitochondrial beta-ketoacyl-CoA synthase,beta-ketoacyl-coenzyme A [Leptomonas pyrrhocoris]KPA77243.1 putative mitochondrial beta-ketoacyl-CoA synthase,beta-ketoacyl-coenzyme A [Leptomonas pyrrhocoris]KPA77244.1 putative mitochondrial beta-ketoacyl-CoA synthas|eukprot:XP_015655682.1 putative mitochondrial beta-ketoacyl-CoA synthase,beta-ketoacyl-coenzyme A [Leptomonas pyrrhocoris]
MFPYDEYVNGHVVQQYMLDNVDYCCYLAFAYLGMVHYGPGIAKSLLGENPAPVAAADGKRPRPPADPEWLRLSMVAWNFFLAIFSICGAVVIVPALLGAIAKNGLRKTVCVLDDELTYTSPCGFWTAIFVVSKIFELVDTLWLVLQKKKTPPFLHWYHHVSVLIFAWSSYSVGSSTMSVFAAMNICVHSIMYSYFALCACGVKKLLRPFAPFITALQIAQMVGGSVLTFYSYAVNASAYNAGVTDIHQLPCAVSKSAARFGVLMYVSYLYLFSQLFVNSYMKKPAPASKKAA